MGYRVEVDTAPAYELLFSLSAYLGKYRDLDLGLSWMKSVKGRLRAEFAEELARIKKQKKGGNAYWISFFSSLLIWQCPVERSATSFLEWLQNLSPEELYKYLLPWIPSGETPPHDFGTLRDQMVSLLTQWNDQYFSSIDPLILDGLQADAEEKKRQVHEMVPEDLIERATNGMRFAPIDVEHRILLIPQYHYVPVNLYSDYKGMYLIAYPCDALPTSPEEPSPALLRLMQGLADKNRLRILRFLAEGPRSFMEIVRFMNLAKSTVHHHLVTLRAAGLIQVQTSVANPDNRYLLRTSELDKIESHIRRFLEVLK